MTNRMNFFAVVGLLAACLSSSASAFRSPRYRPSIALPGRDKRGAPSYAVTSFVRRRRLDDRPSPMMMPNDYDDDEIDDDYEGYEILAEGGSSNNRSRPVTTFGAENVPIDFRPSNEYLNLIRQPTFGWASQESGDMGLALRLAIVYAGFFSLV
jgi:hypothetical protein